MGRKIIAATILVAVLLVFSSSSYQRFSSSTSIAAVTPIQHIVIIMQENHGFDNMFGTYPGLPAGFALNLAECMPVKPPAKTPCITPWNADSKQTTVQGQDIPHTKTAALKDYDKGLMDGFVSSLTSKTRNYSMAYYTGKTLPYYWDYAEYYALNYNFLSSALSYRLAEPSVLCCSASRALSLYLQFLPGRVQLDFSTDWRISHHSGHLLGISPVQLERPPALRTQKRSCLQIPTEDTMASGPGLLILLKFS